MKIYILLLIVFSFVGNSLAQNDFEDVLSEVEKNNIELQTLKKEMEAKGLLNNTNIFLPNPEVEYNYLWGSGSEPELGNRTDFSIRQSFDFPSVYIKQKQAIGVKEGMLIYDYQNARMNLLLQVKFLCIDLNYQRSWRKELLDRLNNSERIFNAYQKRLESGAGTILERNKARMNLLKVQGELSQLTLDEKNTMLNLKYLNGNKDLESSYIKQEDAFVQDFEPEPLPKDFEVWALSILPNHPRLKYLVQEQELNKYQVDIAKAKQLPKFTAGYMMENTSGFGGERFQGFTAGITIPLWENKNKVKLAKVELEATNIRRMDAEQNYYSQLKIAYEKVIQLDKTRLMYRSSLKDYNSVNFLIKALDAGEISLLDYLVELEFYYDAVETSLGAERDLERELAKLYMFASI